MVYVLALDHHVGAADCIGLVVIVLTKDLQTGIGVEFSNVLFGNGKHATRPTGRIVQGLDDSLGGQDVIVRKEEKVHHKADDLARGEVVTGFLVGGLIEAPYEFLEDITHFDIGYLIRVQIDFAELGDKKIQTVCFIEFGDVLLKAEVLDNLSGAGRKTLHVVGQVRGYVVGVALKLFKCKTAGVIERNA